ncbi:alkaline phosphatase D family protein [Novosphingobium rosa]|uniref:alkaline phosphatase D family protein n=1 Tax=Novosphingobium rosa TaxID=76978 RepID=UPI00082A004F|nr:alkaline phosphatase D family protein [Novosphingobium rosa]
MPDLFPLSRRALVGGLSLSPFILTSARAQTLGFTDYPFTLGVCAGDPAVDGFVLWTRLAPRPFEPQYGMPMKPVAVDWEVAEDEGFHKPVAKGTEIARPELGHAIHAEVAGLKPGRSYWYRFHCAGQKSLTGRAATLPALGASVERVRFAAVGCQHYEAGWYTAFRHAAQEDLDFFFHYGDFIYEYSPGFALDAHHQPVDPVRRYLGAEPFSLDAYRLRYAQTALDTDLQAARAAHPWFCTYDDHEVQNNWAGEWDQNGTPPELFITRRRMALQAWYEHMPVRRSTMARDGTVDFHQRADYGDLLRLHLPNTRLYRSDQPCGDNYQLVCAAQVSPSAQMINPEQESWLNAGFAQSHQRWQGLAQQVMMCPLDRRGPDDKQTAPTYNMDSWAGYQAQRERLFGLFGRSRNVVVVTGDEHENYANDLMVGEKVVASEFVSTSITSGGDGHDLRPGIERWMADNPFLKWTNDRRGYVVSEITAASWIGHYRTVDAVSRRDMPIKTAASWAVEAGKPGLVRA